MHRLSVRAKLLAFACIVLAPVALVAYASAQSSISTTRTQILSSTSATTSLAVASVDDFLIAAERLLQIMASSHAVQTNDQAAIRDLLMQTLDLSPEYRSLYLLDADLHVQVKVPNAPPTPNEMRYAGQALRSRQTSISGRLSDASGLTAAVAVPVIRGGQVSGALGVELALDRLQRNIADTLMREHAVIVLLDGDGHVLVAADPQYYADNLAWPQVPVVQQALRGEQGAAEYRNPMDGRIWLGAFAPVRRAQWAVLVSYPSDEVFAPVRAATQSAALSLGGVLLLAIGLALWLAARFTRPLQQVKATALAITHGDYRERVPPQALPHDEVGELALAFNQMADALEQHMHALLDAQREIEQKARDLQQLLDRSVTVQEAERKRIAQEIHDGITQTLVGSIYQMQAARQALASSPIEGTAREKLNDALALVSETVSEIRRVIFDLHPTILDELGLVPALQRLTQTSESEALHVSLQVEGTAARLPSAQELAIYRITQEALNNVRQHAAAHSARITLRFERDQTTLKVRDDGRGLRAALTDTSDNGVPQHLGLIGMRERAQSVGGRFELTSEPEAGTSLLVTIPKHNEPTPARAGNGYA